MDTTEMLELFLKKYAVGHKNGKKIEQLMTHCCVKDDKIIRDAMYFLRTRPIDRMVIIACPTEGYGYFIPNPLDPMDIRLTEIYVSGNKNRIDNINIGLIGAQNFLSSVDPVLPM